jgi:hypothetical protein
VDLGAFDFEQDNPNTNVADNTKTTTLDRIDELFNALQLEFRVKPKQAKIQPTNARPCLNRAYVVDLRVTAHRIRANGRH